MPVTHTRCSDCWLLSGARSSWVPQTRQPAPSCLEGLCMSALRTHLADIAGCDDPMRELASFGEVFAVFEQQDSGCLSYGIAVEGARWFVKLASPGTTAGTLRSTAQFHDAVRHPVILAPIAF